jgi:hypothetical protein
MPADLSNPAYLTVLAGNGQQTTVTGSCTWDQIICSITGTTATAAYSTLPYATMSTPYTIMGTAGRWVTPQAGWHETVTGDFNRAAERAERTGLAAASRRSRDTARARGMVLFESLLDDTQRAMLHERSCIELTGSDGRRYRIRANGIAGNVDLLNPADGRPQLALCAHLPGREPSPDHWAAQLLALTTDAERFLRTANIFQRYGAVPNDVAAVRAAA